MEELESLEHVPEGIWLWEDCCSEVICPWPLPEATPRYDAHPSLLQQLFHIKEVGLYALCL
jgi:hypothetical protein